MFTGKVGCIFVGGTEWRKTFTLCAKMLVKLTTGVNFINARIFHMNVVSAAFF